MVHGPWPLAVSQTVSQNKVFDLFTYSAKILIRLKVRTEVVPQQGIELRPWALFICRQRLGFLPVTPCFDNGIDSHENVRFVNLRVTSV